MVGAAGDPPALRPPPSALRPPPRRLALLLQALSLLFSRFLPLSFLLLLSPKCSVLPSPRPPPPSGSGRDRLRIKPCFGPPSFLLFTAGTRGEKVARARKKGSKNIFRALPIGGQKVRGRTGGKEGVTGDEGKGGKKEQPKEEKAIYALRMNRTAGCRRRLLLSSCGGGGWRSPGS